MDVSKIIRTGRLREDPKFLTVRKPDGTTERICVLSVESQVQAGDTEATELLNVLVRGEDALEHLHEEGKVGASVELFGAMLYKNPKDGSLCARATGRDEIKVTSPTGPAANMNMKDIFIDAEEFFRCAEDFMNGKK